MAGAQTTFKLSLTLERASERVVCAPLLKIQMMMIFTARTPGDLVKTSISQQTPDYVVSGLEFVFTHCSLSHWINNFRTRIYSR